MALVCCVAVFAVAFAACNDNDGKSGNGGGTGDVIFTEDASLEDILTALENAESYTYWYTQESEYSYVSGGEIYRDKGTYEYKLTKDAMGLYAEYHENESVFIDRAYNYRSDGVDYTIMLSDDPTGASESAEKSLAEVDPDIYTHVFYDMGAVELAHYLTTDTDGKIVINVAEMDEGYVQGSGYVKLTGNSIEIGYGFDYGTDDVYGVDRGSVTLIWRGVNATAVEIPGEVRALEAEAEWADRVTYNGILYEKAEDENGEEYYYVYYVYDESADPEETINTLPVRER